MHHLSLQNEVSVSVHVDKADHSAYRLLLRYANPGAASVTGRITASRSRGGKANSLPCPSIASSAISVSWPPSASHPAPTLPKWEPLGATVAGD